MNNESKRLFLAIPISEGESDAVLHCARVQCTNVCDTLYHKSQLHLTLRFLGLVPSVDVPQWVAMLDPIINQHTSFELSLKQMTHFGGKKQHVMVALSNLTLALAQLYRDISSLLDVHGIAKETRSFRPHVTLSRRASEVAIITPKLDVTLKADRVVLYESVSMPEGSVYREEHVFTLQ